MAICSSIVTASVSEYDDTEVFKPEFAWAVGYV